ARGSEEVRDALLRGAHLALRAPGAARAAVVPVVVEVGARGHAAPLAGRQTGGAADAAGGLRAEGAEAEEPALRPAGSAVGRIRSEVRAAPPARGRARRARRLAVAALARGPAGAGVVARAAAVLRIVGRHALDATAHRARGEPPGARHTAFAGCT